MRPRVLVLSALAVPLLLVGCGGDDGAAAPSGSPAPAEADTPSETDAAVDEGDPSAGGPRGRVTTDGGVYDFEATTCIVDDVEGEINGPGTGPDGGPVYVDVGYGDGYAAVRIDLGTDEQFVSSEEIVNIELDVAVEVDGTTVTGTGTVMDELMRPGGAGSVEVTCG